ncbi:MAG TPA: NAD+ synthase [Thermoplasmata archaeon]|nr:NAD+ synthase [Thermoplasmata archaeon]
MSRLTPRPPPHAVETIHQFLRAHALGEGADGIVVGLSGGIDSALVARLARDALGAAHVLGVLLPDASFPEPLLRETEEYATSLGIEFRTVPIETVESAYRSLLPELADRVSLGNVKARIRMTVEYAIARERHRLVAGTGNKSELLLGYFTKYGDGGVDLLPIGDLYKTDVRAIAEQLDLPAVVRERPPTAGLWEGQTDEEELGISYHDLDQILNGLEQLRSPEEIAELTGFSLERVRSVDERVLQFRHKRRMPPIPKVRLRTIGIDWRE